jgi:APA family basic amino acid/polyamine antiporter
MKPTIGLLGTCALVIGNVIGAGIYFLPVSLAPFGIYSIGGWLVTAVGALMLALVFGNLARRNQNVGGPYTYARMAFGNTIGFQMAWCYWASCWISNSTLAIACVSYLSVFVPSLASNRLLATGVGISLVWLATAINAKGVKQASLVQILLNIVKLSPLIAVGFIGLFFINDKNLVSSHMPIKASMINSAALLTLYAFLGMESATIPAQHVINAQKTIPRATVFGTLGCAILYIIVTISVIGVLGTDALAHSQAPIADVARVIFGEWAVPVAAFGAVVSAFGCLLGWILLQGQMPYAMAKDGLFPDFFGKLSRNGVPLLGMTFSSLLITGLMFMNYIDSLAKQFTAMVTLSTFVMLVPYSCSALANLYFCIKENKDKNYKKYMSLGMSLIALAYSVWLLVGASRNAVLYGVIYIIIGFIFFWARKLSIFGSKTSKDRDVT